MSTRGAIGWIMPDGTVKAAYNHSDSYPDWLGARLQEQMKDWASLPKSEVFEGMREVGEESEPTLADRAEFAEFSDPNVNGGKGWYSLLRRAQGRLDWILKHGVLLRNYSGLYEEWAYLLDLRTNEVVILENFSDDPALVPDYLKFLIDGESLPCCEVWRGTLDAFRAINMAKFEDEIQKTRT